MRRNKEENIEDDGLDKPSAKDPEDEVTGEIRLARFTEMAGEIAETGKFVRDSISAISDPESDDADESDFLKPPSLAAPDEPDTIRLDESTFSDSTLKVGLRSRDSVNDALRNEDAPCEDQESIDNEGRQIVAVVLDYTSRINFGMDISNFTKVLEEMSIYIDSNLKTLKQHSQYKPLVSGYNISPIVKDIDKLRYDIANHPEHVNSPYFKNLIDKLKNDVNEFYRRLSPTGTRYPAVGTLYGPNGKLIDPCKPVSLIQTAGTITLAPEQKGQLKVFSELAASDEREKDDRLIAEYRKFNDSQSAFKDILRKKERNFARETEIPSVIMEEVMRVLRTDDRFREFRENKTRILEYGPGAGNEAIQLLLNFPNIIGYHAIEGDEDTKKALDQRLYFMRENGRFMQEKIDSKIEVSDYLPWFKLVPHTPNHYSGYLTSAHGHIIQFCESGMHYFTEDIFRKKMIKKMWEIAWKGTGIIIMAFKTPKSDTFNDHMVINEASRNGYWYAQHKTQVDGSGNPLKRVFMEEKTQPLIFDEGGLDILERTKAGSVIEDGKGNPVVNDRALVQSIYFPGYELDNKSEHFVLTIARPKGMRRSY